MSAELIQQLHALKDLLEAGVLTQMEFEEQKSALLLALKSSRHPIFNPATDLHGGTTVGAQDSLSLSGQTRVGALSTLDSAEERHKAIEELSGSTAIGGPSFVPEKEDELGIGSRIGDHQITAFLGKGGMGQVFKARHCIDELAKQEGDVAIKVMHAHYSSEPQFKARFIREASLGKTIFHPNVANVHHVYTHPMALVLSFIDGKDLSDMVPTQGMNCETVISILRPIAVALDYLHEKGIIHRDIKPENIKVTPLGVPMLLDFGIAKDTTSVSMMTQTNMSMGTEAYMPPEQMMAKTVGPRADQYALAMTLYECICGSLPWAKEETSAEVVMRKVQHTLRPLSEYRSDLLPALNGVVQRGLNPDPTARYESCLEFLDAVAVVSSPDLLCLNERQKGAQESSEAKKEKVEVKASVKPRVVPDPRDSEDGLTALSVGLNLAKSAERDVASGLSPKNSFAFRFVSIGVVTGLAVLFMGVYGALHSEVPLAAEVYDVSDAEGPIAEEPTEAVFHDAPAEEPMTEEPTEAVFHDAPAEEPTTEEPTEAVFHDAPAEEPIAEEPTEAVFHDAPAEEPITEEPTEAVFHTAAVEEPIAEEPTEAVFHDAAAEGPIAEAPLEDVFHTAAETPVTLAKVMFLEPIGARVSVAGQQINVPSMVEIPTGIHTASWFLNGEFGEQSITVVNKNNRIQRIKLEF